MDTKDKLFKRFKNSRLQIDKELYKKAKYNTLTLITAKNEHFFDDTLSGFIGKLKQLWKTLNLFRMGIFGAAHGWGRGEEKRLPLPKICDTYHRMMKLGTGIAYLEKIQKIYESRGTASEFC